MSTENSNPKSFYDRPNVEKETINVGNGIPFGVERVSYPLVGIGGVYGTWGDSYSNDELPKYLEEHLGHPLPSTERLNLSELGFLNRQHLPIGLTNEENINWNWRWGRGSLLERSRPAIGTPLKWKQF